MPSSRSSGTKSSPTDLVVPDKAPTLADLRSEFLRAEEFVLEVQNFVDKAGIPAINELRNVGHHLLRAMNDAGKITSQQELNSAVSHARRSCYEASEAGILAALQVIKKFKDDYATVEIGDIVPGYSHNLAEAAKALRLVEKGRQSRDKHTIDFDIRMTVFRQLRDFCDLLDVSRDEMNKRVAGARKDVQRFTMNVLLAALAILVSILAILLAK
jgi:hypothetical protein